METSPFLHARLQAQRSTRKCSDGRKVGREEGRIIWTWQQRPGHGVVMLMMWCWWCCDVDVVMLMPESRPRLHALRHSVFLFRQVVSVYRKLFHNLALQLCACEYVQLLLCSWPCGLQLRLNILQFSRSSHECLPNRASGRKELAAISTGRC